MRRSIVSALEDGLPPKESTSTKAMETEVVMYAHIGDPAGLDQCTSKERHVQVEGTLSTGVRCRVRHVNKGGQDSYSFTYKLKTDAAEGGSSVEASIEHTVPVDQPFFHDFVKAAERIILKTRYIFDSQRITMTLNKDEEEPQVIEIPNVQFEVDVFDGQPEDGMWCKIDLEVDNILNFLKANYPQVQKMALTTTVTTLPFKPGNILLSHSADEAVKEKISELWKSFAKQLNTPE